MNFKKIAVDLIYKVCGDHRFESAVEAKLREVYERGRSDRKEEEGREWISLRSGPDDSPGR